VQRRRRKEKKRRNSSLHTYREYLCLAYMAHRPTDSMEAPPMRCAVPVYTGTIITGCEQTPELGSTVIPLPYRTLSLLFSQLSTSIHQPTNLSFFFFYPLPSVNLFFSFLPIVPLPQEILDRHTPLQQLTREKKRKNAKKSAKIWKKKSKTFCLGSFLHSQSSAVPDAFFPINPAIPSMLPYHHLAHPSKLSVKSKMIPRLPTFFFFSFSVIRYGR